MIFGRGPELKSKGGPSLFFFFYENFTYQNFFFGPRGARAPFGLNVGPSLLQILHSTKHLYFYHLHTSQEMPNTHTKSPSHEKHELLLLNPFAQKAPRSRIKTLLLEDTTTSYKSSSFSRHKYFIQKLFLMEGNTIHNFTTIRRALSKGKLIQVHDKRDKLNQLLHTAGHTLSLSLQLHSFSPSILKLSWQTAPLPLESLCWDIISSQSCTAGVTNHTNISDFASLSLNLHY